MWNGFSSAIVCCCVVIVFKRKHSMTIKQLRKKWNSKKKLSKYRNLPMSYYITDVSLQLSKFSADFRLWFFKCSLSRSIAKHIQHLNQTKVQSWRCAKLRMNNKGIINLRTKLINFVAVFRLRFRFSCFIFPSMYESAIVTSLLSSHLRNDNMPHRTGDSI